MIYHPFIHLHDEKGRAILTLINPQPVIMCDHVQTHAHLVFLALKCLRILSDRQ